MSRRSRKLAVRLLSRGRILREAVADALALPEDDVLRRSLDDMLQRLEIELRTDEGQRLAVLDLCEAFGIDLTPERRIHLESLDWQGSTT